MAVVGTAGHVDHGKSTLVRALTGRDPDRWAEERARGLTIDLGFAWATLPDGTEVSFVDVPGHERFMKNMLAGIEAVDVALLVVDVEEGWKPQTEEHLAVLDLLGVERGIAVLTKVDRADADTVELARLEVEERLAGTSLAGAAILPVSALTGDGLDELVAAISAEVAGLPPPLTDRPRMWIDRAFTIAGAGTVVTGTLLDGALRVGERMTLFPQGTEVRIRGLQSHERPADPVEPRRRVAANVAGVGAGEVPRGSMLGRADQWHPTDRVLARLRPARYVDALGPRGAYHLHVGSGAWPVRLRPVDGESAVLTLPAALPLRVGDRFILRETGRRLVVAGGEVLDPHPPTSDLPRVAGALAGIGGLAPDARAALLLSVRGHSAVADLAAESAGGLVPAATVLDGVAYPDADRDRLRTRVEAAVDEHHRTYPLRPGMPVAELSGGTGLSPDALALLVADSDLVLEKGAVRRSAHRPLRSPAEEQAWGAARRVLAASRPGAADPGDLGLGEELVHDLARRGELVRVAPGLVFLPEAVAELMAALRSLPEPFTVGMFKSATGLSRKFAVPFLEWADREGMTVRAGDVRRRR